MLLLACCVRLAEAILVFLFYLSDKILLFTAFCRKENTWLYKEVENLFISHIHFQRDLHQVKRTKVEFYRSPSVDQVSCYLNYHTNRSRIPSNLKITFDEGEKHFSNGYLILK